MRKRLILGAVALAAVVACKKTEPPAPLPAPPVPTAPPAPRPDPMAVPAPADVKAPPADAQKTPSGLASKVLKIGAGTEHPGPSDAVKIDYTGWTTDGRMFKSTVGREPEQFPVGKTIKGLTEGLQLMVVGERRRLWVPTELGYAAGAGEGMPQGMLVLEVELLAIQKAEPMPAGVLAPAKDARKTKSGLLYKVLKPGKGKDHPKRGGRVEVHYTGWTREGKEYDSSVTRGRPSSMGVSGVFPGWEEALQLMVVGEKTRFWFPSKLAFGDSPPPNAPAGMMIFDVELLKIQ